MTRNEIPTKHEVDKCISDIALNELENMPIGSSVAISECIGYKKMGYLWTYRVFGVRGFFRLLVEEIRRKWVAEVTK